MKKFYLDAISVQVDFHGNIYILTRLNELIKLDEKGIVLYRYSNNYLGQLQLISIHSPLQIVLFYPGFQTLIFLDKSLNEIKRIGLERMSIPYVNTLGYSPERELWYFDDQLKRFKKVNILGRHILESNLDFKDSPLRVKKILIQKNEVKAWCDSSRIITMDLNGNFKEMLNQEGEWVYWKDEVTGFFHDQILFTRIEGMTMPSVRTGLAPGISIHGIGILDRGIAAIDLEGNFYLFQSMVKP